MNLWALPGDTAIPGRPVTEEKQASTFRLFPKIRLTYVPLYERRIRC